MSSEEKIVLDQSDSACRPRYTHYPSGEVLVRQEGMAEAEWLRMATIFLGCFPKAPVRNARGDMLRNPLSAEAR